MVPEGYFLSAVLRGSTLTGAVGGSGGAGGVSLQPHHALPRQKRALPHEHQNRDEVQRVRL